MADKHKVYWPPTSGESSCSLFDHCGTDIASRSPITTFLTAHILRHSIVGLRFALWEIRHLFFLMVVPKRATRIDGENMETQYAQFTKFTAAVRKVEYCHGPNYAGRSIGDRFAFGNESSEHR